MGLQHTKFSGRLLGETLAELVRKLGVPGTNNTGRHLKVYLAYEGEGGTWWLGVERTSLGTSIWKPIKTTVTATAKGCPLYTVFCHDEAALEWARKCAEMGEVGLDGLSRFGGFAFVAPSGVHGLPRRIPGLADGTLCSLEPARDLWLAVAAGRILDPTNRRAVYADWGSDTDTGVQVLSAGYLTCVLSCDVPGPLRGKRIWHPVSALLGEVLAAEREVRVEEQQGRLFFYTRDLALCTVALESELPRPVREEAQRLLSLVSQPVWAEMDAHYLLRGIKMARAAGSWCMARVELGSESASIMLVDPKDEFNLSWLVPLRRPLWAPAGTARVCGDSFYITLMLLERMGAKKVGVCVMPDQSLVIHAAPMIMRVRLT